MKTKKSSTLSLEGRLKGREQAHEDVAKFKVTPHVVVDCSAVKTMGQGYAKGLVEVLLLEGKAKALLFTHVPPHAVLYLSQVHHDHKLGKRLKVKPR